jgi:hypothetical protein
MNFRVDPFTVIKTLHSIVEQKDARVTFLQAVNELAAKGLALPGETEKEQCQVLAALVNLCDPSFLDTRPGRGGGVGLPSMHGSSSDKAGRRKRAAAPSSTPQETSSESSEENQEFLETGT